MAARPSLSENLEMLQESLRETLKETAEIRNVAVEEEVLIGVEKMARNCNSALRYAKRLHNLVTANDLNGRGRN